MEVTRGKIISLTQSKAEMEQSKKDLEAKRELLAKELEQVNQEIADVDSRLSQLPSALQQLETKKHEQASQTYQLHKCLRTILGSEYDFFLANYTTNRHSRHSCRSTQGYR